MNGSNDRITVGETYWINHQGKYINVRVITGYLENKMAYYRHDGKLWGAMFSEFYERKPILN